MSENFVKISNEFWGIIHPLIPQPKRDSEIKFKRTIGGGRKPSNYKLIFEGILYVLKTGCQWNAVPKQFGAKSSIHRYFQAWNKAGFFDELWKTGLFLYDEMQGIKWDCQIIDASHHKAIRTQEKSSISPVDRKKKWKQIAFNYGCKWHPIINNNYGSKIT